MFIASSIALFAVVLILVLWVRPTDIEQGAPPSPTAHLDERKSAIYSNLRDLTFEYRLGKLSDADYEKTKHGLQEELAKVMAELDGVSSAPSAATSKSAKSQPAAVKASVPKPAAASVLVCPHCKANFDKPMKFCGECGKPIAEVKV